MLQPFDPLGLLLVALLNPAVVAVAFLMGRRADQLGKVVIAGFVGAIAGAALLWVVTFFKIVPARGLGGEAGAFMASFFLGLVWATIGYLTRRRG